MVVSLWRLLYDSVDHLRLISLWKVKRGDLISALFAQLLVIFVKSLKSILTVIKLIKQRLFNNFVPMLFIPGDYQSHNSRIRGA